MSKFKKYNEYVNENQGFSVEAKSIDELIKAVNELPDTIDYVSVQSGLSHFNPDSEKITPKDKDWKKKIEKIVRDTIKGKGGKEMDTFILRSYYGKGGPKDPYYIRYSSKGSRKFAADMGSGKYGPLD